MYRKSGTWQGSALDQLAVQGKQKSKMKQKLTPKQRLEMIKEVIDEGHSITSVCKKYRISRVTFYNWQKRYKEVRNRRQEVREEDLKNKKTKAKKYYRQATKEQEKAVLDVVLKNPSFSIKQIKEHLPKNDQGKPILGTHGVYNVLYRNNLNTKKKREEASLRLVPASLAGGSRRPEKIKFEITPLCPPTGETSPPTGRAKEPEEIKGKLTARARLEMIERVVKNKEKVSSVCREYGVSRVIFYRFKKRYDRAAEDEKLKALSDRKPKVKEYWRQTSSHQVQEIKDIVLKNPNLSSHKIAQLVSLGNHGVQNVLKRLGLNTFQKRLAYQTAYGEVAVPAPSEPIPEPITTEPIKPAPAVAPQPALGFAQTVKAKLATYSFLSVIILGFFYFFLKFIQMLRYAAPGTHLGLVCASISLVFGVFFFLYSLKYYLGLVLVLGSSRNIGEENGGEGNHKNGIISRLFNNRNSNGVNNSNKSNNGKGILSRIFNNSNHKTNGGNPDIRAIENNLDKVELKREPFVSIHLPFYNEKKVVNRILTACTSMEYENYEVVVVDDSNDETVQILEKWKKHPRVKVYHRNTRSGFKGGALRQALAGMDKRTEFVIIFDADFIPYPDTICMFLKHFQAVNNNGDYKQSNIAAVQGYQWHVLNKSENWITKGVRTEYSGSYVIERATNEILKNLRQIAGSVYMIRADVLKKFGWGTSITEDFELTLRIYAEGWKVMYTPYIQAPSECVSTLKRLIKQRMRWAEGHSHNIKRMFWKLIKSPYMGFTEKLETLYLSPYYLQAAFFLVGSVTWFISEAVLRVKLPFWTALWGWSLVFANFLSLPLMNSTGLFLEEGERRDYVGILSFIALCYVVVPFQAYAAVKGFFEKDEGGWFRTPKTGKVTDVFRRSQFFRWIGRFFPGSKMTGEVAFAQQYLKLNTSNNTFNSFGIKRRRIPFLAKGIITVLLITSLTLCMFARNVPTAFASNPTDLFYLRHEASTKITTTTSWQLSETADTLFASGTQYNTENRTGYAQYRPGVVHATNPIGGPPSSPNGLGWIWDSPFQGNAHIDSGNWIFYFYESDTNSTYIGHFEVFMWKVTISGGSINTYTALYDSSSDGSWPTTDILDGAENRTSRTTGSLAQMNFSANEYLYVEYWLHITDRGDRGVMSSSFYVGHDINYPSDDPRIDMPSIQIPENIILFVAIIPFVPWIIRKMQAGGKLKAVA